MQIREIILYNSRGETRSVPLRPGAVNIITGGPKTGKSALQDIVDYCLGRDTCNVPEGAIWNTVAWYGLLLEFSGTQVFVARKHPDPGAKSNAQVYLEVGDALSPRHLGDLIGNTTPKELEQQLTRLLRVSPNLHVPPGGQTRHPVEASLKHALFLVFQGQSEIANRSFLFHRQGEPFIGQTIKDTLPYFLGVAPEDLLIWQQELQAAKREHRAAVRDLNELLAISGQGGRQAFTLVDEAIAAGLLEPPPPPVTLDRALEYLRTATGYRSNLELPPATADLVTSLNADLDMLGAKYSLLRDRLSAARSLAGEVDGYSGEVVAQRARLQSIGLFSAQADGHRCPLCRTDLTDSLPTVEDMRQSLSQLDAQLTSVETDRPRLRERIAEVQAELASVRNQLAERRRTLEEIASQDVHFAAQRDLDARRSHVAGRISLYLETAQTADDARIPEARRRVDSTQKRIEDLEAKLDEYDIEERLQSILNLVSVQMSEFARRLETEYSSFPYRLDLKRLTVAADTRTGPVAMDRMGSAENWLACHLIAHLALHQYFTIEARPVPRFLFLDQPTQVYYPPEQDVDGSIEGLRNEDQLAVRRIFALLFSFAEALAPHFQIIITDHADLKEAEFRNAVVQRWRGDEKLIPLEWLS